MVFISSIPKSAVVVVVVVVVMVAGLSVLCIAGCPQVFSWQILRQLVEKLFNQS